MIFEKPIEKASFGYLINNQESHMDLAVIYEENPKIEKVIDEVIYIILSLGINFPSLLAFLCLTTDFCIATIPPSSMFPAFVISLLFHSMTYSCLHSALLGKIAVIRENECRTSQYVYNVEKAEIYGIECFIYKSILINLFASVFYVLFIN
jgi:hypothetical protein